MLQLFTLMMGDIQYDTLGAILGMGTVASRLAVTLAGAALLERGATRDGQGGAGRSLAGGLLARGGGCARFSTHVEASR